MTQVSFTKSADHYRAKAAECEAMAGLISLSCDRARLLEMAAEWREIAHEIEAREAARPQRGEARV